MIYTARNIENNTNKRNKILYRIDNRYHNFSANTIYMIDSILTRHTDSVTFYNISIKDSIIYEPEKIKDHIKEHFKQ